MIRVDLEAADGNIFLGVNEIIVRSKEQLLQLSQKLQKERSHPRSNRTHLLIQYKLYKLIESDGYRANYL